MMMMMMMMMMNSSCCVALHWVVFRHSVTARHMSFTLDLIKGIQPASRFSFHHSETFLNMGRPLTPCVCKTVQ